MQSITAFMTKITKFSELSINGIGICTLYMTVKLVPPSFQNIFLTNGGPEGGSDNVLKYILSVDISSSDEYDRNSETFHEHDKEQPKEKLYCSYRKIIIKRKLVISILFLISLSLYRLLHSLSLTLLTPS